MLSVQQLLSRPLALLDYMEAFDLSTIYLDVALIKTVSTPFKVRSFPYPTEVLIGHS